MHRGVACAGIGALLALGGSAGAQVPPESCRTAVELYRQGRADDSVEAFRQCLDAVPVSAGLLSDYGAALAAAGAYDEALAQYTRALELAPGHPLIRRNIALAYYKSGRPADAVPILAELHAADPSNVQVLLLLADSHVQLGEAARAVEVLAPFEGTHAAEPAFAYVFGLALMNAGEVERAGRVIDPLLRDPSSAEAQLLLGSAALARGDLPAAVAAFARAAALNPTLPMVHSLHGQALLGTGDADGAAAAFGRELAANPNDFDANLRLGQIRAERGDAGAEALFERARRVRPSADEPVLDLARLHARAGALDRARDELERLVAAAPANAVAHRDLSSVYGRLGRAAEAAREAAEAARLGAPAVALDDGLLTAGLAAPAFDLPMLGSVARAASDALWRGRPAVLVFGSLSCPKFRFDARSLQAIADRYADRVSFLMVYVHEAHDDATWQSTINERERISVPAVATLDDKQRNAAMCLRTLALRLPAAVDGLDRRVEQAYRAWPSAAYVVDAGGRIRWRSRLGEQELSADDMQRAIEEALAAR
jgi:predicted Zn-dependent protease